MAKARVLVVDDSAFMRKVISDMIAQDDAFEVIGTARDGLDALEKIERLQPDVVTLDVEMPRKDGLATLRELMGKRPVPVIMLSSVTQAGTKATMEALALGAVDFIAKPSGSISLDIEDVREELLRKLKAAVGARVQATTLPPPPATRVIAGQGVPPPPACAKWRGASHYYCTHSYRRIYRWPKGSRGGHPSVSGGFAGRSLSGPAHARWFHPIHGRAARSDRQRSS